MKELYNKEQLRGIIADCAWKLRKAYAEKDKIEFRYQMQHFGAYYVAGFISEEAYHRACQMSYEML